MATLLGFALAFALGWSGRGWLAPPPADSDTAPAAPAPPKSAPRAAATSTRIHDAPRAARDLAALLRTAQRAPTRAARLLGFAAVLERLSRAEYPALLRHLHGTNTPERSEELALLFAAWARHAGAEAFAAAHELARRDGQHAALQAAIGGWAAEDPGAAHAALMTLGLVHLAGDEMAAFLRGWATRDPRAVEAYLQAIPVAADSNGLPTAAQCGYDAVARARVQAGAADALAWYRVLPEGLRERLRQAMAAELTAANPALACRWLADDATAQLSVSDLLPLLRAARVEGLDAQFAWAQAVANDVSREAAMDAVVREAAATDLVRLGEWLAARGDDPTLAHACSKYAAQVARRSPHAAVTWALSLDEPELRRRTLDTVALEWAAHDPRAARRWAGESRLVDWESLMR